MLKGQHNLKRAAISLKMKIDYVKLTIDQEEACGSTMRQLLWLAI